MIEYLKKEGYEVVQEFDNVTDVDFCKFFKNGHEFEIRHCFVRNGKQNKFFVKMDGKTLATRCLFFEAINQMERALQQD